MGQGFLTVLILALIGLITAYAIRHNRTRRTPDERLDMWLSFLLRPSPKKTSRGFKKTTARLGDTEYDEIKRLFTPTMKAEWEERQTQVDNEFSIRAIQLEKVFRRQTESKPLSSDDLDILAREGVRNEEVKPNTLELVNNG